MAKKVAINAVLTLTSVEQVGAVLAFAHEQGIALDMQPTLVNGKVVDIEPETTLPPKQARRKYKARVSPGSKTKIEARAENYAKVVRLVSPELIGKNARPKTRKVLTSIFRELGPDKHVNWGDLINIVEKKGVVRHAAGLMVKSWVKSGAVEVVKQ